MRAGQLTGSAFGRDRRGNVAILWALMGAVLVGLVGISVDFTRAQTIRAQMQNAADGAALVAERGSNLSMAARTAAAKAFFDAEVGDLASTATFTVTQLPDGGHRVAANVPMPPSLARLISPNDWDIHVAAEAEANASPPIEVALVLDNTGSMSNDMDDLRSAAQDLAEYLMGLDGDSVSVSLVPFVAQVNIGTNNLSVMDTAGTNPHHGEFLEDREILRRPTSNGASSGNCTSPAANYPTIITVSGVSSPYTVRWVKSGSTCIAYNASTINMFTLFSNLPASVGGWNGCVEARPPPYDINDAVPSTGTPATRFVPYFAADEGGDDAGANNWLTESTNILNLSNTSGVTYSASARTLNVFKYRTNAAVSLVSSYPNQRGPQRGCPTPIIPLTTNQSTIVTAIQGMRHWNGGGTNQVEGLVWGWRVLSPTAPFTQGRAYNDPNDPVQKVLVMMTDGENTSLDNGNDAFESDYSSMQHRRLWRVYQTETLPTAGLPGILSIWRRIIAWTGNRNQDSGRMVDYINTREETLCDAIKAAGIEIYTIQFRDSNEDNETRLQECASGDDHFFTAANASQLNAAFSAIGSGIGQLRITH